MYHSTVSTERNSATIPRVVNKTSIWDKEEENSKENNNGLKAIFKHLQEIYYNPLDPGSFSGIDRLYQRTKQL